MNSPNWTEHNKSKFNKLFFVALALVLLLHGLSLPYTSVNTYDAYIHMFFGDHYARSWFDPWEPRWYTGFTTTSYPPGSHMLIAVFQKMMSLVNAFNLIMLIAILILILGIYRFSMLLFSPRAAGYASVLAAFSTSIGETVHLFGQLPTILSLGLFLNAMPHVYRWLTDKSLIQLIQALCFAAAATAAHHVTTIFGTILFIGPVGIYSWLVYLGMDTRWQDKNLSWIKRSLYFTKPLQRGILLGFLLVSTVIITVFPYWYWSITDPITQVSIPHGSRENFLERLDLGMIFFVIPWSWMLLVLPYVAFCAFRTRLWPFSAVIFLCLFLGLGDTTPIARIVLGPAFDILTLDRFTFWGTILALPFAGKLLESLVHGSLARAYLEVFGRRAYLASLLAGMLMVLLSGISVASLSKFRPSQPEKIDPHPIVRFLSEDQHHRWRYMTLGFGDQFAYISALTHARSVDGNYHSARRLPELVNFAVERLENSKYLGVPGLGSLQQFLANTDKYHLKFIFSNDAFYDPLLHFNGWNRLIRLPNNIVVWEKPDVVPLPSVERRKTFPKSHRLIWGILPPTGLFLGFSLLAYLTFQRSRGRNPKAFKPINDPKPLLDNPRVAKKFLQTIALLGFVVLSAAAFTLIERQTRTPPPEQVLVDYYKYLDFREFEKAYDLLAPEQGLEYESFLLWRGWVGGMIASFAKLNNIEITRVTKTVESVDIEVNLEYLTPFGIITDKEHHNLVLINGQWRVANKNVHGYSPTARLLSEPKVAWQRAGKRYPTVKVLHRDIMDRPRISVLDSRLVKYQGRYHLVGTVRNDDVDPAALVFKGTLLDSNHRVLSSQEAGVNASHRLLPGEVGYFDIIFEGVFSLNDGFFTDSFDPNLYVPVILKEEPVTAGAAVSAVVNEKNLYRSLSATSVEIIKKDGKYKLKGLVSNVGAEESQLVQIQYAVFDFDGRIVRTGWTFLKENLGPGQSRYFNFPLDINGSVEVISDVPVKEIRTNGIAENALEKRVPVNYQPGFLPLPKESGYSGVTLSFKTMNLKPLF